MLLNAPTLNRCFAAVCAAATCLGLGVAACSSDVPAPPGVPDPSMPFPTGAAGTSSGGSGSGGTSAAVGGSPATMRPPTSTDPKPDAGTDSGTASMPDAATEPDDDAGSMRDCTPVTWANPGNIDSVELTAIAADAGDNKVAFDQSAGMTEYDYQMEEFFITGKSPAYTTRMMVRRPRDPAKFSGAVFVEWYNVSAGLDMAVVWSNSREYFMREGHVYVAVSAQAGGAEFLKQFDATRYARVSHPGDAAANDIFSQAGAAIRLQTEKLLGPCMPVRQVFAAGQSQSSARLAQYVNSIQSTSQLFDGFFLHAGGEPASSDPVVPVFTVLTQSEGNGSRSDGSKLVKWVVAGATHNDDRMMSRGLEIADSIEGDVGAIIGIDLDSLMCSAPMNDHPSFRAYNAALDWLLRWVRDGQRPPTGMPFETSGSSLRLDMHDNVVGGVRSPEVDVPTATYAPGNGASSLDVIALLACGLAGSTTVFAESKLAELYPTHERYVELYTAAADKALAGGYMLRADYEVAIEQARKAPIPKP